MSRLARDLLLGVALTLVALAVIVWWLAETTPAAAEGRGDQLPRLVCPLH
jgi:hypothetical protein